MNLHTFKTTLFIYLTPKTFFSLNTPFTSILMLLKLVKPSVQNADKEEGKSQYCDPKGTDIDRPVAPYMVKKI